MTGYFLNHTDTFGGESRDGFIEVELPAKIAGQLTAGAEDISQLPVKALAGFFSKNYGLPTAQNIELDNYSGEVIFDYDLPAGYASVIVDTQAAQAIVEYRKGNWLAVANDLHKGRHTGSVWSWVIDLSAWLMVLFALTGIVLVFHGKKHRKGGVWATLLGIATPLIFYFLFVPGIAG